MAGDGGEEDGDEDGYLAREGEWGVRRMGRVGEEMRRVALVQAEAFHIPVALFNDFFFDFFKVIKELLLLMRALMLFLVMLMLLFVAFCWSRLGGGAVGAHLQGEEFAA